LFDEFSADVGEPVVASLEAIGELEVIESEEVEQGGMEIIDVDGVLGDIPSDLVGLTDDLAPLDTASREENSEGEGVVIATGVVIFGIGAAIFPKRSSTEFSGEDDEGRIEEAALFEVLN